MKSVAGKYVSNTIAQITCITLDDDCGGSTLVWNPDAQPGESGAVGWDVLGGADTVIAADRIGEGLLSIIDDPPSLLHRPEAELLCADLLAAARQGRHQFQTVLEWAGAQNLAPAHRLLASAGDEHPADDIDWFHQIPADEQRAVWQILARALEPLRAPQLLMCLQPPPQGTHLPGVLRTLFTHSGESIERPRQLLVVAGPHTRGVAAALVDRLLWAGYEHGVRVDARPVREHDDAR
ncbi:hypothetical protein [Nocardia alni]|uniref:hypothetical protein n=1 Tax=Nocardia alni TaxID=2815723 RepID=UPI001C214BFB|nr:hypothetical protein [Nocardia alni]